MFSLYKKKNIYKQQTERLRERKEKDKKSKNLLIYDGVADSKDEIQNIAIANRNQQYAKKKKTTNKHKNKKKKKSTHSIRCDGLIFFFL